MTAPLKDKVINSMLWVTIDKTGNYTLIFISNLILARLLMPEDFGSIAMLQVFLTITDIIVHGGFVTALIQKKNPSHLDYSSVFYVNLSVSIVLYLILFFCAPLIADFYKLPLLCILLRVQAIGLIINSFSVVQLSILKKHFKFKALAIRNILSSLIGLTACLLCAFGGLGVWSLVVNNIVNCLVSIVLLWRASDWRPTFEFSFASVKELFGFGGFMMLSSIIGTFYDNLQSLLIGRFYTASDLGYVNQAKKLEAIPSGALASVVTQVSFPTFSNLQDNNNALRNGLRKNIKSIEYINLPMMLLLMVIAEPLILLLYGERWATSIPYFQILCISRLIAVIVPLNMSIISAKGRGKLYFGIQIIKCFFAVSLVVMSVRHGILALMIALTLIPYFDFMVCSIINGKMINCGLFRQIEDILPTFAVALVIAILIYCMRFIPLHPYVIMIIQSISYIVLYLFITKLTKFEAFEVYHEALLSRFSKRKKLTGNTIIN